MVPYGDRKYFPISKLQTIKKSSNIFCDSAIMDKFKIS